MADHIFNMKSSPPLRITVPDGKNWHDSISPTCPSRILYNNITIFTESDQNLLLLLGISYWPLHYSIPIILTLLFHTIFSPVLLSQTHYSIPIIPYHILSSTSIPTHYLIPIIPFLLFHTNPLYPKPIIPFLLFHTIFSPVLVSQTHK